MSKIYREKWWNLLKKMKEDLQIMTDKELLDSIQKYLILTELAIKEIKEQELPENHDLEIANAGLDLSSSMFNDFTLFAVQKINPTEVIKLLVNTISLSIEEKISLLDNNLTFS